MDFRIEQQLNNGDEERIVKWLCTEGIEHINHVGVVCIYSQL